MFRYVTRGTFDAYMWQTLERKATFVAQLHREDSDTREIDDLGDVALGYAEVKALAAGNPALLEHARAAADVARLRILQALDAQTLTAARAPAHRQRAGALPAPPAGEAPRRGTRAPGRPHRPATTPHVPPRPRSPIGWRRARPTIPRPSARRGAVSASS